MAYSKTTWQNGDVITAPKLNKMEQGIFANYNAIESLEQGSLSAVGASVGDIPVADGNGNWNWLTNGFVTPEMYGAVGDGVTDDTESLQNAVNYCCENNSTLVLCSGKHYKITETINITKRMILDGNGSKITSTATWAFYVHPAQMWDGEFTTIRNLYLICVNGIKIESIRTQLLHSRVQNTDIAVSVLHGSYESIIQDCYFVSFSGVTSIGIECKSSDIIFNNITGYGQKIFVKNYGTSSIFDTLHGWPIDEDYDDSIFFYENSLGFSAHILNCHSDTYQYAIRSTHSMNHLYAVIKNLTCNWANKDEGWLFYAESNDVYDWQFMMAEVILNTLPTTFHICNLDGAFCLNNYPFSIPKTDVELATGCYLDGATIRITGDTLYVCLLGSVNTGVTTHLELYIPYCRYFAYSDSIPVFINGEVKSGKAISWSNTGGTLKIDSTDFTANSGYVPYIVSFSRRIGNGAGYTNT